MKRDVKTLTMRHAFRNGRTKLQFWIIGAWTNHQQSNRFGHALFISQKHVSGSEDHRLFDLQIRHRIERRKLWEPIRSYTSLPSATERTHLRSLKWAHEKALKSFMRKVSGTVRAKGSVKRSKTVPDLSRLMYYSAKSTLEKCRQTEKETDFRFYRA